ncbi:hypothetical protein RQM47_01560 [Rubrivirga sp. S365]|uniref:Uncharacterized protein n=1 Tax=Rubrivirga litoralis TaxID=3075598 RepID=A0ABU3BV23_9BACT|nr:MULTISPECIES: hypothetical protein [unclassified Rubrivirga]MDT0633127.1 hypothetical protein [Rubrivirga sp. F394]MDT7855320.1 hypothetical protein [Rubrivirga sp. S365]
MTRTLSLAAALALLAGCASTRPAPLTSSEGRAEVNARAAGRVATVRLGGERPREVRALRVGPDTTIWVDRLTGEAGAAPTAALSSVSVERSGAGGRLLKGAAIGAGVGGLLGAVYGATDGGGWVSFTPVQAGAAFAVSGAVYGTLVGLVAGRRDVYRPAPPEAVVAASCGGLPLACAAPPRRPVPGAGWTQRSDPPTR